MENLKGKSIIDIVEQWISDNNSSCSMCKNLHASYNSDTCKHCINNLTIEDNYEHI